MKCLWCQKTIIRNLLLTELFFPWQLKGECCLVCQKKLAKLSREGTCPTCMKPVVSPDFRCNDCDYWRKKYSNYDFAHRAMYHYDSGFQDWLHAYKFLGDYRLRQVIAKEVKKELGGYSDFLICGIPLSSKRFAQRGFNQVEGVLEAAGISRYAFLQRKVDTKPQAQKNRQERLAMEQPYELAVPMEEVKNKQILLVDDVYTTGRTLFHGAEVLLKADAKLIRTFSFAR
ncbi:hypothetical protein BAU16_10285 [Enterococcus sp. JM9B]|nr:hypothetical protein BAU16_10285 [Enterococcus sp. JM9B]